MYTSNSAFRILKKLVYYKNLKLIGIKILKQRKMYKISAGNPLITKTKVKNNLKCHHVESIWG